MGQDRNKKFIDGKARRGMKGYPVATIAFYGPTNTVAAKLVCSIMKHEDADVEPMKKWFSENDLRKSERVLGEVLTFIEENNTKSIGMFDDIIGCPHEEGIDYPDGESCPKCPYWKGCDRFTHGRLH